MNDCYLRGNFWPTVAQALKSNPRHALTALHSINNVLQGVGEALTPLCFPQPLEELVLRSGNSKLPLDCLEGVLLHSATTLRTLDLSETLLEAEQGPGVYRAFGAVTALQTLLLDNCNVSAPAVLQACRGLRALRWLGVAGVAVFAPQVFFAKSPALGPGLRGSGEFICRSCKPQKKEVNSGGKGPALVAESQQQCTPRSVLDAFEVQLVSPG